MNVSRKPSDVVIKFCTMTGSANYGLQGAASLIKSITSMALLLAANYGVRLFGREGIY